MLALEPLLQPIGDEVYVTRYRRHKHPKIWALYEQMLTVYWVPEEIILDTDVIEWNTKLKESERTFLKNIFAFFSFGDGMVIENHINTFMSEIQDQDIKFTYVAQIFFETIHANTYAMILDTLVKSEKELQRLEALFRTDEGFVELKNWVERYMDKTNASFASRILAFACFEGIIFSGAFCAIFWLKKRGLMPGLTFSNELISRDEGLHCDFGCLIFELCEYPPTVEEAHDIIRQAVNVGTTFITKIVPCDLLGINAALMVEYLKFVGNRLFGCLFVYDGQSYPYPGAVNPFDWMVLSSLEGKTNFFERRVSEYGNAALTNMKNSPAGRNKRWARLGGNERGQQGKEEKREGEIDPDDIFTTDADF
jgi:ribonucleotide reductase beta subunit family protein with ferritin-like domain